MLPISRAKDLRVPSRVVHFRLWVETGLTSPVKLLASFNLFFVFPSLRYRPSSDERLGTQQRAIWGAARVENGAENGTIHYHRRSTTCSKVVHFA